MPCGRSKRTNPRRPTSDGVGAQQRANTPSQIAAGDTATNVSANESSWMTFIMGSDQVLGQITCVTYLLHPTFTPRVQSVSDRGQLSGKGFLFTAPASRQALLRLATAGSNDRIGTLPAGGNQGLHGVSGGATIQVLGYEPGCVRLMPANLSLPETASARDEPPMGVLEFANMRFQYAERPAHHL